MNPFNFFDPFGKQHWIIEEELAQEEALREHLIKKYGEKQGEIEFSKIKERKRIIETTMVASFGVGVSTALIAPYLSVPALIATFGSISTYSALESYSNRKQAGQTEIEAKRGAFAAATGIGYLFNLMGFDYGTLEPISQEETENTRASLVGFIAGGWLGKMFGAQAVEAELAPEINMGKQGKHIPGNKNYIPGRSILTADPDKLASKAGTGQPVNKVSPGMPGYKERIDFGFVIGEYCDKNGVSTPTTIGIITYSKDGRIHIIPARPK